MRPHDRPQWLVTAHHGNYRDVLPPTDGAGAPHALRCGSLDGLGEPCSRVNSPLNGTGPQRHDRLDTQRAASTKLSLRPPSNSTRTPNLGSRAILHHPIVSIAILHIHLEEGALVVEHDVLRPPSNMARIARQVDNRAASRLANARLVNDGLAAPILGKVDGPVANRPWTLTNS